ncbi:head-tail connector protein [Sphingobacterium griseoflavum]|uniref:Phage gp6-like head-tail connector protein n=1 Tax=Sphingobacterium griseoflavum TaxID=1474952 RepID=A0ABQ3HU38_9SPHI|nr:head-tail connector protein [Sphingobacterium griseoflavum]GHE34875.1 hypothetical protein GCM10017764_17580 [Sphingobacterium griseoflavum]
MVTLDQVKEALSIDYPDQDNYLDVLLKGSVSRAEKITGRNYTNPLADNYEAMPFDVQKAVVQLTATDYAVRDDIGAEGANSTADNAAIYTLRAHCKTPMF